MTKITVDKEMIERAIEAHAWALDHLPNGAAQTKVLASSKALRAALAEPVVKDCLTTEPAVEPVASQYKQELGSKNCIQCATAYLLGVPLDDVPNFERAGPDAWETFYAFFTDRGFTAEMFPSNVEIDGDYLASGDTERGTSHMVVMRGGKLLHDPHPSNAGLRSIKVVWLIVHRAGAYTSPPPPAEVPLLSDEESGALVREASKGGALNRDGSTSQRIARAIEQAVRQNAGLK